MAKPAAAQVAADLRRLMAARADEARHKDPTLSPMEASDVAEQGGVVGMDDDLGPPESLPGALYQAVRPQTFEVADEDNQLVRTGLKSTADATKWSDAHPVLQTALDIGSGGLRAAQGAVRASPWAAAAHAASNLYDQAQKGELSPLSPLTAGAKGVQQTVLDIPAAAGEVFQGGTDIADAPYQRMTRKPGGKPGSHLVSEGGVGWGLRVAGTALAAAPIEAIGRVFEWGGLTSQAQRRRTWRDLGSNPVSALGYDVAEAIKRGDSFMALMEATARTQGYAAGSDEYRAMQTLGLVGDTLIPFDNVVGGPIVKGTRRAFHTAELAKLGVPKATAAGIMLGDMLPSRVSGISLADLGESMRPHANERFHPIVEQTIDRLRTDDPALSREDAVVQAWRDQGRALLGNDQLVHLDGVGTIGAKEIPKIRKETEARFAPFGGAIPDIGQPFDLVTMQKILADLGQPIDRAVTHDGTMDVMLRDLLVNESVRKSTVKPSKELIRYSPLYDAALRGLDHPAVPDFIRKEGKRILPMIEPVRRMPIEFSGPLDALVRDVAQMPQTVAEEYWRLRGNERTVRPATETLMSMLSDGFASRMGSAEHAVKAEPGWQAVVKARLEEHAAAGRRINAERTRLQDARAALRDARDKAAITQAKAVAEVGKLQADYAAEVAGTRPPRKVHSEVRPETHALDIKVAQYLWENRNNLSRNIRAEAVKGLVARGVPEQSAKMALGRFQASRDYNPKTGNVEVASPHLGPDFEGRYRGFNPQARSAAVAMDKARGIDVPADIVPTTKEGKLLSLMHRANRQFDKIRDADTFIRDQDGGIADVTEQIEALPTDRQHAEALRAVVPEIEELLNAATEPQTKAQLQGLLVRLAGHVVGDVPWADVGRGLDTLAHVAEQLEDDAAVFADEIERAFTGRLNDLDLSPSEARGIVVAFGAIAHDGGKSLQAFFASKGLEMVPVAEGVVRMIVNDRIASKIDTGTENIARLHGITDETSSDVVTALKRIMNGQVKMIRHAGKELLPAEFRASPTYQIAGQYLQRWGMARVYDALSPLRGSDGVELPKQITSLIDDAVRRGEVPQFGWRKAGPLKENLLNLHGRYRSWWKQMTLIGLTPFGLARYLVPQVLGATFSMVNHLGIRGTARVLKRFVTHPALMASLLAEEFGIPRTYGGKTYGEQAGIVDSLGRFHSAREIHKAAKRLNIESGYVRVEAAEHLISLIQKDVEGKMPWFRDLFTGVRNLLSTKKSVRAKLSDLPSLPGAMGAWQKVLWDFAQSTDAAMRMSVFVDQLAEGKSAGQAADASRSALLDFGKMTEFERNYLSKAFLFYSFTRANFDSYVHAALTDPSRVGRQARFLRDLPEVVTGDDDTTRWMRDSDKGRLFVGTSGDFALQTSPMPLTSFLGVVTDMLGAGQAIGNTLRADPEMTAGVQVVPQTGEGVLRDMLGAMGPEAQAATEIVTGETPAGYQVNEMSADNEIPGWLIWLGNLSGSDAFNQFQADYIQERPPNAKREWMGDTVTYAANNEVLWKNAQRLLGLSSTLRDLDRATHGMAPGLTPSALRDREDAVNDAARDTSRRVQESTKTLAKRKKARRRDVRKP